MKTFALVVLAAGGSVTLFGEAAGNLADAAGTVGGITGLGSVAFIVWVMNRHQGELKDMRGELKETREDYSRRENARDTMFNGTVKEIVNEFKESLNKLQEDNQNNIERQFQTANQITSALEQVNRSLHELTSRMDAIEGGSREVPALPPHLSPPPGPNPGRRRGDQK
jgi:methyl-accepting chemotaxis protein